MTAVAKTYTFVPGTTIEAAQANQNFDDIVGYINSEVIVRDASKAFTAIPSGPGTDPSTSNQFTRKQYVDDADALRAKLDGTTAFTGIPSGPNSDPTTDNQFARKKYVDDKTKFRPTVNTEGQIFKTGESVVSTDAFGHATISFAAAFPTAIDTILLTNNDATVPSQFLSVHARSASSFTVRCYTAAVVADGFGGFALQRATNQSVRVGYIAIGH